MRGISNLVTTAMVKQDGRPCYLKKHEKTIALSFVLQQRVMEHLPSFDSRVVMALVNIF